MNTEHTINRAYFDGLLSNNHMSLRGLARKMNMGHSQLSLAFAGQRKLQLHEAVQLSEIFSEPLSRIAANAGVPVHSVRTVPVIGLMHGDGTVEQVEHPRERASLPDELPDGLVAVQCHTAESALEWIDGAWLYCRIPEGVAADAFGRLSYCKIENGPRVLAALRRGYQDGTFNLAGLHHAESVRLEWATPVLLTRH